MRHCDLVFKATLVFLNCNHVCFTVIQISQISSIWIWVYTVHIHSSKLSWKCPDVLNYLRNEYLINKNLTRIIMTEHLMLWIVSYTFLEMSTNWLSSKRCTVFLLKLSNAIFTWFINSGITVQKTKHKQNSVSIKKNKTCNCNMDLTRQFTLSDWIKQIIIFALVWY